MEVYKDFTIIAEDSGYRVENRGVDCGFYYTYNQAVSAIDMYYKLINEVYND